MRPLRDGDLDRLVLLIGDWEVTRWLARVPHPYTAEDGRGFIRDMAAGVASGRDLHYTIALRDSDLLIGGCGFLEQETGHELGYWLGRPYWGRGYGPEALSAVIGAGFAHLGEDHVFARVLPDNLRSRRLLERLGFRNLGLRPSYFPMRGLTLLVPHYELARADWPRAGGSERTG